MAKDTEMQATFGGMVAGTILLPATRRRGLRLGTAVSLRDPREDFGRAYAGRKSQCKPSRQCLPQDAAMVSGFGCSVKATHNKFELFLSPRFFPLTFFHYGACRFAPIESAKFA